jgi:molecular chaperone Hsp33
MSAPDLVQPFQLELPNLRGRMVRLGTSLDSIIKRHDYPPVIATLLAEAVTLAALLAGMLKFDGVFTLQAKGNGAVSTLVADITSQGHLRAYANFAPEQLTLLGPNPTAHELLGNGYLAFTVDQGAQTERYQGLVDLSGQTLTDFIQHYFAQSEQIDTVFKTAVQNDRLLGWQAGGIMLQRLPERDKMIDEDGWQRAQMLLGTTTNRELIDPQLETNDLLYRLFHEETVRVYEPLELEDQCRCTRERVAGVLQTLSTEDLSELTQDGPAEVHCQFCARLYKFTAKEVQTLRSDSPTGNKPGDKPLH